MPGGSVIGCPKINTLKLLNKEEKEPRRIYTGSFGYFRSKQDMSFNIIIRSILNFKKRDDFDFIGSDVISKGVSANMSSIIINRGSNDGVLKHLPVLSSRGVVGKITAVSKSSSEVQLISDVNFRLSVKIAPDEVEGIMRWIGEDLCEIAELKKISDIEIGDIVLTSNLSIYFPPNLPVGEVVSIFEKSDSSNRVVTMKLFSDFSTINQLFVLLNEVEN